MKTLILFPVLSIIVSVIIYYYIWNKIQKKVVYEKSDMVKYELRVVSYKLRVGSLKARVEIQKF